MNTQASNHTSINIPFTKKKEKGKLASEENRLYKTFLTRCKCSWQIPQMKMLFERQQKSFSAEVCFCACVFKAEGSMRMRRWHSHVLIYPSPHLSSLQESAMPLSIRLMEVRYIPCFDDWNWRHILCLDERNWRHFQVREKVLAFRCIFFFLLCTSF